MYCMTSWPQISEPKAMHGYRLLYLCLLFMCVFKNLVIMWKKGNRGPIRVTVIRPQSSGVTHREMKIRIVLSLPIPRGSIFAALPPKLFLCLTAPFQLSHPHISTLYPPLCISFFSFCLYCPLATHEQLCATGFYSISGRIFPMVNKCCGRGKVEEMFEHSEEETTPQSFPCCCLILVYVCLHQCILICECLFFKFAGDK